MPRKVRSDKTVGKLEEKAGLPNGSIRNKDGKNTRSDKTLGTIRKEQSKQKMKQPQLNCIKSESCFDRLTMYASLSK